MFVFTAVLLRYIPHLFQIVHSDFGVHVPVLDIILFVCFGVHVSN